MRVWNVLTTSLFVLCCADTVVGRQAWQQRRDDASPASTHKDVASTKHTPSPTSAAAQTSKQQSAKSDSKASPTAHSSGKGGTSTALHHHTTDLSHSHGNGTTNGTASREQEEQLPIQPKITPAVGVIGAVLLLTGVAYTVIGIRYKSLLVFLSTAYLGSLGVTVLIIYIMNPPVSDAIQGAYFVAAFFTGVIFGGLAIVFQEVAEGFGCLIGGFCVAMWLLCLKPGGLLTDTVGKAVMIGVISAVAWSLSFSHFTRGYGSIVCVSFAGATATMLGVDCYTRAGLKEFWIYIWNINKDEFPLHTTTYPMTRGIIAEIAGIIVIFLLGLISQFKVWKLVRERRAKKEAERSEGFASRDQRDSYVGKQTMDRNSKALEQWEAMYGEKDTKPLQRDSAHGTSIYSMKRSTSVTEREVDAVELADLTKDTGKPTHGKVVYNSEANDDEIQRAPALKLDIGDKNSGDYSWWSDYKSAKTHSQKDSNASSGVANEPSIVPLPLPATSEKTGDAPVHERRGVPLGKLALQRKFAEPDPASIEDDRASSVAATADEEPDFDALSTKRLSVPMFKDEDNLSPFSDRFSHGEEAVEEDDAEKLDAMPMAERGTGQTLSKKAGQGIVTELKDGNLPKGISRVASTYRTNEWAKHIAEAEQPDAPEEDLNTDEAAVQIDIGRPQEAPRVVDTTALSPISPSDTKPPKSPTTPNWPLRVSTAAVPIHAFSRSSSSTSIPGIKRRSSAPLSQLPLASTPISEDEPLGPNLLDERSGRLERKPTTTSFNGLAISPTGAPLPNLDTPSSEDLTLAQRKSALHAQNRTSGFQRRESAFHTLSQGNGAGIYDSHQPRRHSSTNALKQNAMLTQWRQSLANEQAPTHTPAALYEQAYARQSMVDQLRYAQHQGAKKDEAMKKRESRREVAMRTGEATSRHQEAMRRMQSQAKVSETKQ